MIALSELKEIVNEFKAHYTEEELNRAINGKGSIRCALLPNWSLKKNQTCKREFLCSFRQNSKKDVRCALWLVKIGTELRKKHWLKEVL